MKFLVLWHFKVDSNEELDRLLGIEVYNYATYKVLPLAEMGDPGTVVKKA
jgi:hypothetical protein